MLKQHKYITLRFYEELNDFLPYKKRKTTYTLPFFGKPTVKDIIESQGVPHTEIDLILVNDASVTLDYHIHAGDRVSVYPEFEMLDIGPVNRLRTEPLRKTRFITDVHLGKLSRYLRMLGLDTLYRTNLKDTEIIQYSIDEKRIILTRDLGILKNSRVLRGYYVRNSESKEQCREVIRKFSLTSQVAPFTRCMECNGEFVLTRKDTVRDKVPERVYQHFEEFFMCGNCKQLYWKGSHYEKMKAQVHELLKD